MKRLALTILLLVGGCSADTTLAISVTSSVEIADWSLVIAVDGSEPLARALPLPDGAPRIGALGTLVVVLPNRSGHVTATIIAHDPNGETITASAEADFVAKKRTNVQLALDSSTTVDGGSADAYLGPTHLTVTLDGEGTGRVIGGGIDCPGTCSFNYSAPMEITLTATPSADSAFAGWSSGPCATSTATTCTFTPGAAEVAVVARFYHPSFSITIVPTTNVGATAGTVTSSPAGVACGATCIGYFPFGSQVTLTATTASGTQVAWGGPCHGVIGDCVVTVDGDSVVPILYTPANYVFVTSVTHDSNFGGLAGVDQFCQDRATAGGLAGTYRAWVSTSGANAKDRLGSARGWIRPDGRPFVDTVADLLAGRMFYPPRVTELNVELSSASDRVATLTHPNGTYAGAMYDTCSGWMATAGSGLWGGTFNAGIELWTGYYLTSSPVRIYCFGIDSSSPLELPTIPSNGRRAFISTMVLASTAGISAADAACSADASAAGLPGTYKALLATVGTSASSRFNTTLGPWYRIDGAQLAPTAAELFTATRLMAPLTTDRDGNPVRRGVWLGAGTGTGVGTAASTCTDWTSTVGTGTMGDSTNTFWWPAPNQSVCGGPNAVACLQE